MATATDLSLLQETAIRIQKDLKLLPYAVLREELGRLGITLFPGVQNKDVMTHYLRKQGIAKPYIQGSVVNSELGKAIESTLEVMAAYASVKDNIQNYKKVSVGPDVLLGKNKSKKHPWNIIMLTSIVKTFTEDVLDALFPAEHDAAGTTPLDLFDGFDTLIDAFIASGEIASGEGNLVATGAIDSSNAFTSLLAFWRSANPLLKKANTVLQVPYNISEAYDDAFFTKFTNKPTIDGYNRTFLEGSAKKCLIVPSTALGTGNRIILTALGNMDFGMDSEGDDQFVQVRDPYEDPNEKQFWIQSKYGCRIRTVHKKIFQINDGTPVATQLSGDYS